MTKFYIRLLFPVATIVAGLLTFRGLLRKYAEGASVRLNLKKNVPFLLKIRIFAFSVRILSLISIDREEGKWSV